MYTLQREDKTGRIRTLHRNVLLPIGSLLDKADDKSSQEKTIPKATPRKLKPKPQPRISTMQKKRINKDEESYHKPADASDSDDSITYVKQVYEEQKESTQLSGDVRSTEVQDNDTEDALPSNEEVKMSRSAENEEAEITKENEETENIEEREAIQVDNTAPVEHSDSDTDMNVKLPSRPTRTRRKPMWMREDQYVLSMNTQNQTGNAAFIIYRICLRKIYPKQYR